MICLRNHIYQLGELTYKNYPVIDFRDEPVIRCDIPIAGNIFANECK